MGGFILTLSGVQDGLFLIGGLLFVGCVLGVWGAYCFTYANLMDIRGKQGESIIGINTDNVYSITMNYQN